MDTIKSAQKSLNVAKNVAKNAVISIPTSLPTLGYMSINSNNSSFTIKSAPSRTPSVLTGLSTHSGWLEKKDESGNWNLRFVCAVPHTFLYYFSSDSPSATPCGIIDLECYTNVIRTAPPHTSTSSLSSTSSSEPSVVLQLCGSDRISPNLRSFYFRAPSPPSADLWTDAFLSGRHDSLLESLSAFKDLQGGYSKQLNACNEIAIQAEARGKESRDECYRVRQNAEGNRGEVKKGALEVVKVIGAIGGGGDDKEGGQEGQRDAVKRVMKLSREGDVAGVMEVILERVRGQREELEKSKEVAYELRFEVTEGRAERELEVAEVKKRAEELRRNY
ncbi:hypothetical protein TrCOL_g8874 [Triparma columacea]|uniref:PH domain-containing protein n=1 Tax=Triparma columacea TaxID=722753 RepID=A0A9W7GLJ7_9STRA|nr:hypothetical protein TrCOL_g8874 [Triparma columacea]